ncbi:MnhB domain-containing protein [Coprothermobacter platensis]|uniref:MnhB domain-containing protein n=1 Tax=Coprothermobacter platensis TaxID=108819 RepID=UPI000380CFF7|nr:MnhB domain-containing protein [Coprothermobacter platensis]
MTMVPKTIVRFISPIAMTFGAYVVLHGHLSPGGGFQGGVIVASIAALFFLVFGADATIKRFNVEQYTLIEALGGIGFAGLAVLGLWKTGFFMGDFLGVGTTGKILSAGVVAVMNFFVGVKVFGGIVEVITSMAETKEGDF